MAYDKKLVTDCLRIAVSNLQEAGRELRYSPDKKEDLMQVVLENVATVVLNIRARI
jgi:hypothetical protein